MGMQNDRTAQEKVTFIPDCNKEGVPSHGSGQWAVKTKIESGETWNTLNNKLTKEL